MFNLLATLGAESPHFAGLPLAAWEWFRPGAATNVQNIDWLFWFITWISIFFFVLIAVLTVQFVFQYRHRPGHTAEHSPHHNNTLEIVWSVIPLLLVVVIFFFGFIYFLDGRNPPDDAMVVDVQAYKWGWAFKYDKGAVTDANLHVPIDRPVKLVLSSKDVLHSLYIPAFRVKMDCVPGKYTDLWFRATQASQDDNGDKQLAYVGEEPMGPPPEDDFDLFCTEYCGTGHSSMYAKVVVHESGGFDEWLKKAKDPRSQGTPVEVGAKLYAQRGCAQCHSIDGKDRPGNGGPSFKGHWGKTVAWTNGQRGEVDDSYIRESILNPMAKIRTGYRPIMPTFQGQLNDDQIYALIQFIKDVNEEKPADWQPKEGEEGDAGEAGEDASESADAAPEEPAAEAAPAEGEEKTSSDEEEEADSDEAADDDANSPQAADSPQANGADEQESDGEASDGEESGSDETSAEDGEPGDT